MSNILHLIKVQFLGLFGINKMIKGKKTKFFNGFLGLALILLFFASIIVGTSVVYSIIFVEMLKAGGQSVNRLIPIMQSFSFVLILFFSLYSVTSVIYEFKDYDMLSAMPIKRWQVLVSKFFVTLLVNLVLSIIVVVPSFFVSAYHGGNVSFKVVFNSLLVICFSPFLPLAISCVVGVAFLLFSSLFKHKNLVQILLYLVIFIAYGVFSYISFGENFNSLVLIEKLYFIMPLTVKGLFSTKFALLVCLINIVAFAIVFTFVCLTYNAVKSRLAVKKRDKNFKLKTYAGKGQLKSLYFRELKRLFSMPTYAVNSLFGAFLALVAAVLVLILGDSILQLTGGGISVEGLVTILIPILVFTTYTCPTSNSAISLEGNTLWIIRSMPLNIKKIFLSAILVNSTFYVIPTLFITVASCIVLKFSFLLSVVFILLGVLIAFSSGVVGLLFNILLPNFKWENVQQVVKQGMPVLFTMLLGMLLSGLMILFTQFVSQNTWVFLAVFGGLFLILTIFSVLFINKKGEKLLFRKIDG